MISAPAAGAGKESGRGRAKRRTTPDPGIGGQYSPGADGLLGRKRDQRKGIMAGKLLILDGSSLLYRAFFALPLLTNSRGLPTNAVYGLATMLLRLLEEERPEEVAVALDAGKPTFRHQALPTYKAQREETADELKAQLPYARKLLSALGIPLLELEGYEADDIVATLVERFSSPEREVLVVTGDKDLLQLIRPGVEVLLTRRGITEMDRYDERAFRERFGIAPPELVEAKALMGDSSDNIPGVPGVGEKTALRLVQRFHRLEELYDRLPEAGPEKLRETLLEHRDQVFLSREIASLKKDLPLEIREEELRRRAPSREELRELLEELEFRSLLERLGLGRPREEEPTPHLQLRIEEVPPQQADRLLPRGEVAVAFRVGEGFLPEIEEAVAGPGAEERFYRLSPQGAEALAGRELVGHELKDLLRWMRTRGLLLPRVAADTAVAAYLLDPTRTSYRLADLCRLYRVEAGKELERDDGSPAGLAMRARAVAWLRPLLEAEIEARGLGFLYREVELPLVSVLAGMEAQGVTVLPETLDELDREFGRRLEELAREIHGLAGTEFNINSPHQLAEVLFSRLGLPAEKRKKTLLSTEASVLEALAREHPIAARVLEYRTLAKLKGTYVEGLRPLINPATGRVHARFNQTVTATGRLSSSEPNLQNIPVRDPVGRRIRAAFVAPPAHFLLSCDYSQIELRLLAHFSGDEGLIGAFLRGEDVHRATAAEVFRVPPEEVTAEMRDRAKVVNFGVAYGISPYGLSQALGIDQAEAKALIESYFSRFPGVKRYCEEVVARAREEGQVRTLFGRIRPLPEIRSKNYARRSFAERTAINTPLQGTAADIIKKAMVDLDREISRRGMKSALVLQVHDELILEVPEEELEEAHRLTVEVMEKAARLSVPLRVDAKYGRNWYQMEPLPAEG